MQLFNTIRNYVRSRNKKGDIKVNFKKSIQQHNQGEAASLESKLKRVGKKYRSR